MVVKGRFFSIAIVCMLLLDFFSVKTMQVEDMPLLHVLQYEKINSGTKPGSDTLVSESNELKVPVYFQNADELPLHIRIMRKDTMKLLVELILGPIAMNAVSALPYKKGVALLETDLCVQVLQPHRKLDFGWTVIAAAATKCSPEFFVNRYALWLIREKSKKPTADFPRPFFLFSQKQSLKKQSES